MDMFGFPPRTWAYFVSLELSEVLGHVKVPRGQGIELRRFVDDEWVLVAQLDRLAVARTLRRLPAARLRAEELRARLERLALADGARAMIDGKLAIILEALRVAEGEEPNKG